MLLFCYVKSIFCPKTSMGSLCITKKISLHFMTMFLVFVAAYCAVVANVCVVVDSPGTPDTVGR